MATLLGHVSLQILDTLGVTASVPYYLELDDANTLADTDTAVSALVSAVDNVTDGQIVGVSLVYSIPIPGDAKGAPVAGAEVERGGLFNFAQENIKYKFGVLVPALKATAIVNGKINLADAGVAAFTALLTALGGDAVPVSTAGNLLTILKDALIVFRKHRKAESRRSFEV